MFSSTLYCELVLTSLSSLAVFSISSLVDSIFLFSIVSFASVEFAVSLSFPTLSVTLFSDVLLVSPLSFLLEDAHPVKTIV